MVQVACGLEDAPPFAFFQLEFFTLVFILDCHLQIAVLTTLLSLLLSVLVRFALLAFLTLLVFVLVVWVLPCLGLVLYLL
jgi:hypothetical protein